jgi:hypothetical protein
VVPDRGEPRCVEASLTAFVLTFCFATEHSAANSSEIRANASLLASSERPFSFPYGLLSLTI